ncbi:sensor domain-containing diguanylate cyclase [Sabulicella glaciei]|uniref:Diguanylate cyclase n=1 Tax=Sabulicella glaciei TaxID=2984948 RepID=A0ABT3NXL7_9PROT|nr:sensor domain-containing diguanylate cyclase [Roseococcus sp. MDT2-1-1]MCW8086866.1 diguanylate cyclase [Roseococcus sp. MDT2-1-1]
MDRKATETAAQGASAAASPFDLELLRLAVDETGCNFAVFDRDRYLVAHSRSYAELHREAFARLTPPLRYDDLMRVTLSLARPGEDLEAAVQEAIRVHERNEGAYERRYPDGRWMRVVKRTLPSGHVAGFAMDITELKLAQAAAEQLAVEDPLTHLPNRRGFHALFAHALASGRGGMLLLVDLDRFKAVNDSQGHAAGDAVLAEVARRMRASVRAGDVVCRLGGDEFALLCAGMAEGEALDLGRRLVSLLEQPFPLGEGREARIGASIGVAPLAAATMEEVLRRADRALYQAKAAGRGCVRADDAPEPHPR